jgi:hypothetical protein
MSCSSSQSILNGVAEIDVHIRVSVESHDAIHAGVEAFGELAGHVAQLGYIIRFGLGRQRGCSP